MKTESFSVFFCSSVFAIFFVWVSLIWFFRCLLQTCSHLDVPCLDDACLTLKEKDTFFVKRENAFYTTAAHNFCIQLAQLESSDRYCFVNAKFPKTCGRSRFESEVGVTTKNCLFDRGAAHGRMANPKRDLDNVHFLVPNHQSQTQKDESHVLVHNTCAWKNAFHQP